MDLAMAVTERVARGLAPRRMAGWLRVAPARRTT